eukprot:9479588-Pyramimonas_sp.AAC.1
MDRWPIWLLPGCRPGAVVCAMAPAMATSGPRSLRGASPLSSRPRKPRARPSAATPWTGGRLLTTISRWLLERC